ncbi:MAG TPA: DUF3618 domain-containing protein [Nocardioidaceae bacterium]|nr:DUF3618 domain-containing protein [Nocardioidaceae bacterium]
MSTPARSPEQIAAEIAVTRNRLAGTIDQLVYRAQPKTIVRRQLQDLKSRFVAEDGSVRTDVVAKVAGVTVGLLATLVLVRKLVR